MHRSPTLTAPGEKGRMERRTLLKGIGAGCLSLAAGRARAAGQGDLQDTNPLAGVAIVDAHAHPDTFFGSRRNDRTSTLESIVALGMAASSFSAIGDRQERQRGPWQAESMHAVRLQLDVVRDLATAGKVRLIRSAAEIRVPAPGAPTGAILALEGAHPIGEDPEKVDTLHAQGVRIITVMHYAMSDLGDCMTCRGYHNGVSPAGRKVVERMQRLGILVDVAHADSRTLRQIVDVTDRPVVDSHVSVCASADDSTCGRLRAWSDLEHVAKKGGVICTWPLAYTRPNAKRETFRDWALELLEMKRRLGVAHVGIGTDGGGSLPALIQGYRDVRDLAILARAMREVGFSAEEVTAVFGGNFRRVFEQAVG
jgi:microsomal dipeptidase-like Zn-dependent dipeptidase